MLVKSSGRGTWAPIYYTTLGDLATSFSEAFPAMGPRGDSGVFGFDLSLKDLSRALADIVKTDVDVVSFVMDFDGRLVGASSGSITQKLVGTCNIFDRVAAADSEIPLISRSMMELQKRFSVVANISTFNEVVGQGNPGGTIRLIVEPLTFIENHNWFIVVAYYDDSFTMCVFWMWFLRKVVFVCPWKLRLHNSFRRAFRVLHTHASAPMLLCIVVVVVVFFLFFCQGL